LGEQKLGADIWTGDPVARRNRWVKRDAYWIGIVRGTKTGAEKRIESGLTVRL